MKLNRTWLAGMLAAGALMAGAAGTSIAAQEQPAPPSGAQGPRGWHHGPDGMGKLLAQLNLSPQQQASVKAILANAQPQMKTLHEQLRANRQKLQQTQPNDPNYANVVAQVTQDNGALHSQMITQHESVRAQVFGVLTPAQQSQLAALQTQAQAQAQARGQGHHH